MKVGKLTIVTRDNNGGNILDDNCRHFLDLLDDGLSNNDRLSDDDGLNEGDRLSDDDSLLFGVLGWRDEQLIREVCDQRKLLLRNE